MYGKLGFQTSKIFACNFRSYKYISVDVFLAIYQNWFL